MEIPESDWQRLERSIADLKRAIGKTWVHRFLLHCCDGLVWLDRKWRAWRQS